MHWPDGFMWGTGASATQCEGASQASDWWDWERAGHAPLSGDGNGFAVRDAEDFRRLASLGLRHHSLTIEAARVSGAVQLATAEAAVRLRQTGAPVASIFGLSAIEALDDSPRTTRLADLLDDLNWRAGLELFRDGVLRVPGLEVIERPDLA